MPSQEVWKSDNHDAGNSGAVRIDDNDDVLTNNRLTIQTKSIVNYGYRWLFFLRYVYAIFFIFFFFHTLLADV